ncbi:NAD(P)/FAD-dependent oxidoreductase [Siccirubricoccus sp. KC 17139]|uniref:NAD(P)/FAD-dependent oxidoreductase n=1 Tax=Siccirubricoccus soli TaxID=2899147 RepID=A0ABT1D5V3_9PROT|nr:NAD(P)/FAD-dependent oxidoreductase [Siccirubricoccus soli]MCO6417306.1 NAD(P)/FAD-dependent oxidoreductase [Siccirubricoccus soli]MCP2683441.1 NAD(P)/FAD-dependent oxidoreductase [Siccirubricoccus soli]
MFDAIILGAGAAGLMAAATAGQRGRRVLLLDHAPEPGRKILISGGGRCNFTNLQCAPDRFLSANRHFARSALARYTQQDFIALVRRHGIAFHEKTLGQLFCDGSARQILAMLLAEARAGGVDLRLGHRVTAVTRSARFRVETDHGAFEAPALVLATGGPSIPKLGATGFAYEVARQFGLPVVPPRPALVPLTFEGEALALMRPLSGVALECIARIGRASFREAMLFTHRGLSGPAILQASSYWSPGEALSLDLLPGQDAAARLREGKRTRPRAEPRTLLAELLPQRLAAALTPLHLPPKPLAEVPDRALDALAALLKAWRLTPAGTEGYAKAEVTGGGIDTAALSSRDMQAKSVPGLFAVGEAVDVTGWLGGYNFQWAWSSGWAAGQVL